MMTYKKRARKATRKGFQALVLFALCSSLCAASLIHAEPITVNATCYSRQEFDGQKTASGKRTSTKYIAVARHLVKQFPFGTRVKLSCGNIVLERTVEDTMGLDPKTGKPWTWKVDVFKETNKKCKAWGIKRNCKLEVVK